MTWVYNLASPDPNSDVSLVIAISLVFPVLALLAVAFRFFVRIRLKRTPWYDDYTVLSSALLVAAYGAVAIAQTRYGLGLHADYFPAANVIPFGKLQYADGPVYTLALLGFKVSLLTAYIRIGGFVQAYKTVLIAAIVACVCNQLVFTFLLLFACRPIAKQWDQTLPGHCINTVRSYYALAGTSIGFDILIIALPIPVLLQLQLRRRQKIALVVLFALGFFVTIIQIIRIFTVKNLKTYTDSKPIIIWSVIEISVAVRLSLHASILLVLYWTTTEINRVQVILASIPTYAPFFRAFASNLSSYRWDTGSNSAGSSHPNSQSRRKAYGLSKFAGSKPGSHAGSKASGSRGAKRSHPGTGTGSVTGAGTASDNTAGSAFHSQLQDDYDLEILDDGTTLNKGSGHSTTIMSTSIPAEQRGKDSDSEELIQDRSYSRSHHHHEPGPRAGEWERHTPPDSREDPFQIHTLTEVTVERHNV